MPSKRSHGEGTLRHRSDGRWELRMMDGYQKDGSPRFKTFYGKTQKEVKLKLKEYQDALISGVQLDTILYFEDWADTWFEGHKDNIAPTTQESYKYCLKMLKEGFYHRPLTVIRPIDIENFLKGMRRDGRSDSYISKARGMLYQIFQKAEANDLVRRNPVRLAEKMRASGTAKRKEAFTTAEVAHLMKAFHANRELLTGWLKEELNWDGVIVTDWNDIYNLYERDHIAESRKDAVRIAINAGIDMAMVPLDRDFCVYLRELVEEGLVSERRIDDAVRRILRLKMRIGLFEEPFPDTSKFDRFASDEFAAVALQAAEESEVLLKNDGGLLPLPKSARILLTGPNANFMRCLNGGWSYTWQGERCDEFADRYNTIYEALARKFDHVTWIPGVEYGTPSENWQVERVRGIGEAVSAAADADVIVVCIGENSYCETPGNMNDLNLSQNQKKLVRELASTGKPLVLVLNEGRPRLIGDIEPLAQAVVDILLPGNYGGDALANLLAGDANFSARLPFTYPRWPDALATYDYKPCQKRGTMEGEYNYDAVMDVQWPFCHGLSYTTFEYGNLRANLTEFRAGDTLSFTVDISNTGDCAGKEAVLLWSSDLVASLTPDVIRLRNFEKISLEPGETRTVMLSIPASDLAFVGYDGRWRLEKGDFRIRMGTETLFVRCVETRVWDTPNIP